MEKRGEKEKEKRILLLLGWGHGFWPTPGASARAGALTAQRRPKSEGETALRARVTASLRPTCQRERGDGVAARRRGEPAERGRMVGRR
jgi:hypothetical protein